MPAYGYDLEMLREDARKGGVNFLTLLQATGAAGYLRTPDDPAPQNTEERGGYKVGFNRNAPLASSAFREASGSGLKRFDPAGRTKKTAAKAPVNDSGRSAVSAVASLAAAASYQPPKLYGGPSVDSFTGGPLVNGAYDAGGFYRANPDTPREAETDLWNAAVDGVAPMLVQTVIDRNSSTKWLHTRLSYPTYGSLSFLGANRDQRWSLRTELARRGEKPEAIWASNSKAVGTMGPILPPLAKRSPTRLELNRPFRGRSGQTIDVR